MSSNFATAFQAFRTIHWARMPWHLKPMDNRHPRSAGVTAAATLALLGCGTAFFFWGYLLLALVNAHADDHGRRFYEVHPVIFLVFALVPSGVIALGIRTGIGLFQLRPWARVSALVWASLTLCFCLGLIALRPFETFFIADHFVGELESFEQLISVALVILLLPSSVWWLFLFRAKDVKKQFEASAREQNGKQVSVTSHA